MEAKHRLWQGPVLVLWTTVAVGAMLAAIWISMGIQVPGLRLAIRATARTSFFLYALAFTAAPLQTLFPGPFPRYLVRNRRYFGLSFGISHLYHLGAILLLVFQGSSRSVGGVAAFLPGGVLYLWIFFMMATSNDRAVQWLGPRRWKLLHRIGMTFIFLGFLKGFGLSIAKDPLVYGPLFAMLMSPLGLRCAAWISARRQAGVAVAGPSG